MTFDRRLTGQFVLLDPRLWWLGKVMYVLVASSSRISIHIMRRTVSASRCLSGERNCKVGGSLSMSLDVSVFARHSSLVPGIIYFVRPG